MAKAFGTYSATSQYKRTAKTSSDSNQVICAGETIAVTTGMLTLNTLLGNGIYIPKNAQIVGIVFDCDAMDTNGVPTLTISLGDSGSDARLMAASTTPRAGGVVTAPAKGAIGYQYTAETLVQPKVKAAAATAQAGNLTWGILYVSN